MQKPFFVWQNKVLISIRPEEVVYLSTEGNYTMIYLSNKTHCIVRSTLSGALKKLPPEMFIKTHRAHAVSVYFIETIAKDHLTISKKPIPIARQYYKAVINQLNIIE
jgi:DNA-binding LytR/AlgR family response regulator